MVSRGEQDSDFYVAVSPAGASPAGWADTIPSIEKEDGMTKKTMIGAALLALPLAVGGLVLANSQLGTPDEPARPQEQKFICPLTGEELPCPNCCPLNQGE